MKIALIVPSGQIEMNRMGTVARPSLGVCYLLAFLKVNGYEAKVFHQVDETLNEMVRKTLAYSPDIVGFSTMSVAFLAGVELARKLKTKKPEIITIFGGEHISGIFADEQKYGSSMLTQTLRDHPEIDFTVPFEGEVSLLELVRAIEKKSDPAKVAGIAFLKDEDLVVTESRPRIKNLDLLPMADLSDLPWEKYKSVAEVAYLIYLHFTRGCLFRCIYCCTHVSCPGGIVANSAGHILKIVELLCEKFGDHFFFCDELFTFNPRRLNDFCLGLIKSGLSQKIHWRCFARVDDVSRGKINLALMKKAGCNGLFFGVESMNPKTLKKLGKGTIPEQIKTAV